MGCKGNAGGMPVGCTGHTGGIQKQVVFRLGAQALAQLTAIAQAQEISLSELLRSMVRDLLAEWAGKQGRRGGLGRPVDSELAKRGKVARDQTRTTFSSRMAQLGAAFEQSWEGRWYRAWREAVDREDWEYLIRFNEVQPWLRKWKAREAELLAELGLEGMPE